MKKSALFCILIILFGLGGFSQTHISGVISNNTTWNIPGSPYIIDGNTEIQPGIKLIIEAGVVIKFSNNTTLLIDGELDAIGDFSNHIIITGYSNNPAAGDWNNMHFTSSSVSASYDAGGNYISGSIMKFCDISYGGQLNFGILEIESSAPHIESCSIMHSSSDGIYLKKGFSKMENCYMSENAGSGIYTSYEGVYHDIYIDNNNICNNGNGGIHVEEMWDYKIFITNNKISENLNSGIYINSSGGSGSGTINIDDNVIYNNYAATGAGIWISQGFNVDISCNIIQQNHSDNDGCALYLVGGYNQYTNTITGNTIINNTSDSGDAIFLSFVTYYDISIEINNNMICNNTVSPTHSIFQVEGSSYGSLFNISNNTVKWNSGFSTFTLITFSGHINQNNIYNNIIYEIYNQNNSGSENIDAINNYWYGTSNIDLKIYDFFDDGGISIVNYHPVLTDSANVITCGPTFTTGIETITSTNIYFTVYPIPVRNVFIIETLPEFIGSTMIMYNFSGQELMKHQLKEIKTVIDISSLPKGTYLVKLLNDRTVNVKKIIKE